MAAASFLQFKLAAGWASKGPPPLSLSLSLPPPSSPRNTPYNQRIRTVTRLSVNEPKRDEDEVERKEREKKERKKRRREGGIRRRGRGPFETHESFSLEGQWVRVDGS